MQPSSAYPVLLFSYGTLQDKAVQLANFGRELNGQADRMPGYRQARGPRLADERGYG